MNSAPRRRIAAPRKVTSANSVFINCPFDDGYRRLFEACVFAVIDCGFAPRCALELEDASEVRIHKIQRIIEECRLGLHDLSRTELDAASGLPRFNMPLELGLFLGAKRYGRGAHARKACLILDTERFRYQKFISDLAGQDIRDHGGEPGRLVRAVRDWLQSVSRRSGLPGGGEIARRFTEFEQDLPQLCAKMRLDASELTFADYTAAAATWLDETETASSP